MLIHVESDGALGTSDLGRGPKSPQMETSGFLRLPLELPVQEKSRWCWAAIGSAYAGYFNDTPHDQTEVAQTLARGGTLQNADCNINLRLDHTLTALGLAPYVSFGRPRFDRIAAEIARGLPVAARIEWARGDAHFVVVTGYCSQTRRLWIEDSLNAASAQPYGAFPERYAGSRGVWTETIWINRKENE